MTGHRSDGRNDGANKDKDARDDRCPFGQPGLAVSAKDCIPCSSIVVDTDATNNGKDGIDEVGGRRNGTVLGIYTSARHVHVTESSSLLILSSLTKVLLSGPKTPSK